MRDRLPRFHYPNDGRLSLVIAVGCNTLMRLFVFFFGLLGLDLVDLDTVFRVRKVRIDREGVLIINVLTLWRLAEYPVLGTRQ